MIIGLGELVARALKDTRRWLTTEEMKTVAPCMERIHAFVPGVRCVSSFGSRYYGLAMATSDLDMCS